MMHIAVPKDMCKIKRDAKVRISCIACDEEVVITWQHFCESVPRVSAFLAIPELQCPRCADLVSIEVLEDDGK
jgi:hypothetical protein